jgi:hypothetical protein
MLQKYILREDKIGLNVCQRLFIGFYVNRFVRHVMVLLIKDGENFIVNIFTLLINLNDSSFLPGIFYFYLNFIVYL